MSDNVDGKDGEGTFARARHSIRAQYSLATALFLMMVLGLFYAGGRIVLVHLVREAEQQVKDIGLDISRLAYRNAEQVKRRNLATADAAVAQLAKGETPERLLASDDFAGLSLIVVYEPSGVFLSGAAHGIRGPVERLAADDLKPYSERLASWVAASAKSGEAKSAVGILRVKGVAHCISLAKREGDTPRCVIVGSPFNSEAFAAQVKETFGGVDIRMTTRRADVALSVRPMLTGRRALSPAKGFGFEPMLSEALNFYSGGFWD